VARQASQEVRAARRSASALLPAAQVHHLAAAAALEASAPLQAAVAATHLQAAVAASCPAVDH
jgi:hypothetical protein